MKISVFIIALVMLTGCADRVRTEFATLDDAINADAFARGWLPPILPDGTTAIVEVNNLDHNSGKGSFQFPPESTTRYLQSLGETHGGLGTKSPLGISVVVTNSTTRWDIKLDPQYGRGSYSVQWKRE